jgi:hypothetical protein
MRAVFGSSQQQRRPFSDDPADAAVNPDQGRLRNIEEPLVYNKE